MPKFKVDMNVTQRLCMTVEAETEEEAIEIAEDNYDDFNIDYIVGDDEVTINSVEKQ